MKNIYRLLLILPLILTASTPQADAAAKPGRYEIELSGEGWRLWLDERAEWQNDDIYLPPVDMTKVPWNPPSCGWDEFDDVDGKQVAVPGTVEEHFWGANGNPIGTAGDYRGVSWWSTEFELNPSLNTKRITLAFESVNLRAEIFVNEKLAGYDVIGNTPFEVDITEAVNFDGHNRLDIRITDPVGNFNWNDNDVYRWDKNDVPAVHGFGGITGRVFLRATDPVSISDIYVENKPKPKEVEVFVTLDNESGSKVNGELMLVIHEWQRPTEIVWRKKVRVSVPPGTTTQNLKVKVGRPKLWSIGEPNLYIASAAFMSADMSMMDGDEQRFGFRHFTAADKGGDRRFYLNGDRVFMFCAMTRGYWPKNGIFPGEDMVEREIAAMKELGYNTMLYHRAIGPKAVTYACEEHGFLTYEEPSGYRCEPGTNELTRAWRREKLRRMVMRERSSPSMVIYNLKNEAGSPPDDDDIANIRMIQELDPGRIVTYNSDRNRDKGVANTERIENDPYKLHVLPFDDRFHYTWFDQHHWFRFPGYIDECYNNPEFFLRGVINSATSVAPEDSLQRLDKSEIIFWGEEGQWGTMMRLQKIKEEAESYGATGWREQELIGWYDSYERFLDESGFRSAFPTVDDLTMSMGRNLHYFHGRILENVRIGNIGDAYNLNGWAAPTTSEDIVSVYRYPSADTSILSHYAQPLYLAVKLRDKVFPTGAAPTADIYIVNEKNVHGKHTLTVQFVSPNDDILFSRDYPVNILGGEEFGQLLVEGITLPKMNDPGYYRVTALLTNKDTAVTDGFDEAFVADYSNGAGFKGTAAVIDDSGIVSDFLAATRGMEMKTFSPDMPDLDLIVIGKHDFDEYGRKSHRSRYVNAVMDRAVNGATVIILDQAERWAGEVMDNIYRHPSLYYKRTVDWGTDGRFIVGESPYLNGLPEAQGMNWEYQAFYKGRIRGLDIDRTGNELIVALASECRKDIVTALTRVPVGNGQVFLCTLDMLPGLESEAAQTAVVKKLFLNLIETERPERIWNR